MNNRDILNIAMTQSAIDLNCSPEDFLSEENKIVMSEENPDARRYLTLPFACNLVSYGNNIVAAVQKEYEDVVRNYINNYSVAHCFETPNMHVLNDEMQKYGLRVCFME